MLKSGVTNSNNLSEVVGYNISIGFCASVKESMRTPRFASRWRLISEI